MVSPRMDGTVAVRSAGEPVRAPGLRRLAAGLLLAPAAWMLAEIVGYIIGSRSCEPPTNGLHWYGAAHLTPILLILDIILAIVAAFGLWTAYGSVQELKREPVPGGPDPSFTRSRFLATIGVFASGLFLLGIAWFAIGPVFLEVCGSAP